MRKSHASSEKSFIDNFIYAVITISVLVIVGGFLLIFFRDELPLEAVFGSGELPEVNFETLTLSEYDAAFLACPETYCPAAETQQFVDNYPFTATTLRDRLLRYVDENDRIRLKSMDLPNLRFNFLESVPGRPFPDVVTVQIYDMDFGRSSVAIFSRTLEGEPEEGVHEKRVQRWLNQLETP